MEVAQLQDVVDAKSTSLQRADTLLAQSKSRRQELEEQVSLAVLCELPHGLTVLWRSFKH
jgi:hypothetical protein